MNLDDFIYCPPLVLDPADRPVYAIPPSNWMAYYINAAISPEKQELILRILDWGNSEEGFIAMQMGLAGIHYDSYDIDTRTVSRTPAQVESFRRVSSNMLAFANSFQGLPALQGGSTPEQIAKMAGRSCSRRSGYD
jgi:hypothetical protein